MRTMRREQDKHEHCVWLLEETQVQQVMCGFLMTFLFLTLNWPHLLTPFV